MNILNHFRKPYFSIFASILFLVFSCSQYDLTINRSFSYDLYKAFKESNIKLIDFKLNLTSARVNSSKSSYLQSTIDLLQEINNEYGSDLTIPSHILEAMVNITDVEDIKTFVLNEGLLSFQDINTLESFVNTVETNDFQIAIETLEDEVISRNLSESEFQEFDDFASTLKIVNDEKPELFESTDGNFAKTSNVKSQNAGIIACLVAYVVWIAAIVGFVTGCATLVLCAFAVIGLVSATIAVVTKCSIK